MFDYHRPAKATYFSVFLWNYRFSSFAIGKCSSHSPSCLRINELGRLLTKLQGPHQVKQLGKDQACDAL